MKTKGTTSLFEMGMNPGLISHFAKKGLFDAANYFIQNKNQFSDLNFDKIQTYLKEKNYPKLAQELGLHTIHCSEMDNQYVVDWVKNPPKDLKTKLYNTWSSRGLLNEGLVPIQVARGSHEDKENKLFPRVFNNTCIMSHHPSVYYWAKSWVPDMEIEGSLIPHGEAFSMHRFFSDKSTGYGISQYYVYQFNPYANAFIDNVPLNADITNCNPELEVIHPMNYNLKGLDKVGALLLFKKNRGWWAGSFVDDQMASKVLNHKFGPTVLQVAAGVYAGFIWMLQNPNNGNRWPESLDTDFILEVAKPYLGNVITKYVDLTKTKLKDVTKFEDFVTRTYEDKRKKLEGLNKV